MKLAEARGIPGSELTPRLYEILDPDALERLVASMSDDDGKVVFSYEDYRVTVLSSGEITIQERARP